ncbi:O-antigen ligase family protein [Xenorhabdus stockiae]|uniref:O-antigen ligase family protein n=1 Tax=Xenorhabdus stockiae TaxID=351614 RepID=UPI004064711C
MQRTKQEVFLGYFWLLGSSLYFTQITQFSPVYFVAIILLSTIFLRSILNKNLIINKLSFYFLLTTTLSLLLFLNSPSNMVINIIISLLSPIFIYTFFNKKTISKKTIISIFIILSFIFICDGLWRITNPNLENKEALDNLNLGYLVYKTNSLMYRDSNFLGIHIIIILSSFLFLFKDKKIKKTIFFTIVSLFLLSLILTFSRASLISAIIGIYFYINRNRKKLLLISTPIMIASTILFFIDKFSNDISFNSKFYIIHTAISKMEHLSLYNIFFGYGLGNSVDAIGIGAHNLILTILLEMGLIFFVLFVIYMVFLIKKFKIHFLYLILPFIISSLSLSGTSLPYFFTYITLCLLVHDHKINIK